MLHYPTMEPRPTDDVPTNTHLPDLMPPKLKCALKVDPNDINKDRVFHKLLLQERERLKKQSESRMLNDQTDEVNDDPSGI